MRLHRAQPDHTFLLLEFPQDCQNTGEVQQRELFHRSTGSGSERQLTQSFSLALRFMLTLVTDVIGVHLLDGMIATTQQGRLDAVGKGR